MSYVVWSALCWPGTELKVSIGYALENVGAVMSHKGAIVIITNKTFIEHPIQQAILSRFTLQIYIQENKLHIIKSRFKQMCRKS